MSTSHNVMVYAVTSVVSVYGPDTLHNWMSSAAVLIFGNVMPTQLVHNAAASDYAH